MTPAVDDLSWRGRTRVAARTTGFARALVLTSMMTSVATRGFAAEPGADGGVGGSGDPDAGVSPDVLSVANPDGGAAPEGAFPDALQPPPALAAEPAARLSTTLGEITVVGMREAETGGSAHVLTESKLSRIKRDDPHAILRGVPGVYSRGEDGYGLRPNIGIRGASPDRSKKLTLMEDGVLFGPAPYSAPAAYYVPLSLRIRGVRVVKGPAALSYGPQTVGGAVDFLTRTVPDAPVAMIDAALGQDVYTRLHGYAGAARGPIAGLIEGALLRTDGFKELDGGGPTGFRRTEMAGKLRVALPGRGRAVQHLRLGLGFSEERSHETYLGLTDLDLRAQPLRRYRISADDRMTNWRTQGRLSHELRLGAFEIETTAYRHDFDRVWRKVNGLRGASLADVLANPETTRNRLYYGVVAGTEDSSSPAQAVLIGPNDRRFVSHGLQSTARGKAVTGALQHRLEASARYHFDSIDRHHSQDGFLVQGSALVPDDPPEEVTADNRATTHAVALYATDVVTIGPATVTPGVRTEIIVSSLEDRLAGRRAETTYAVLLPGVGSFVAIGHGGFGVLAGVHRGFSPRAPGEPDSVPVERSWNWEAGARLQRQRLRLEAIGFFNAYGNLTSICTFSSGCVDRDVDRQFPVGRAAIWGAEAYADMMIRPTAGVGVPITLAYTYTRTRLRDTFMSDDPTLADVQVGDELPYVPRHQVNASIGVTASRFDATLSASFIDRMRERAGQGAFLPAETTDRQFLLDGSIGVWPHKNLRLYVSGTNLLDGQYIVARRPFGARPNAPRRALAGLTVTF